MAHQEQLAWEARAGKPAAAAALGALVLQLASQILQGSAFADRPEGDRGLLLVIDDKAAQIIAATLVQALSFVLIAAVLFYLLRCTRYRRSEAAPGALAVLALAPLLYAVGIVLTQLDLIGIAGDFEPSGSMEQQESRAEGLIEDRNPAPLFIGFAGGIALGFSYIVVNLNAMRAGLLSRFMGILGIIVGVLLVLPIFPGGPLIVQIFWLGAVGALFLGRWPGGRGPAWESGTAEPWPSRADMLRRQAEERGLEPEPARDAPEAEAPEAETERPASRKRKRKKRR